ncbi:MAG: cytidine deaminase [Acidaminococcales bacterium]|jgi:cytidine deaminase|nr:cytidine deaminase [Acidaminococcales bacterium]
MKTGREDMMEKLLATARAAMEKAYAPYSGFKVGAAVLGLDGEIYGGCNVENASCGLTVCAERAAVCNAVCGGSRELAEILLTAENQPSVMPCGACLQVLREFSVKKVHIASREGKIASYGLEELLPLPFAKNKPGEETP